MATRQATVDYLLEQMRGAGDVSARKMFGEYGVYRGGTIVALVCDDDLFVKATDAGRAYYPTAKMASPYPGAKPALLVPGDRCEDADWLAGLISCTSAALAGSARPKAAKKKAAPAKATKPTASKPKPRAKTATKAAPRKRRS
jgi:DNA transformation protein